MRIIRPAVITIVIVLSIFSCLTTFTRQVVSQLPATTRVHLDINETKGYVRNLIDDYNEWINQLEKPRRDFDSIKAYFSLYHDAGNSFKVIVIQMDLYNTQIGLIFIRIQVDQPEVIVDYNDTFRTLFPDMAETNAYTLTEKNLPFRYNGTMILEDFLLEIGASDISPAYAQNAYDTAQYLYQQDHSNAPPIPTVNQTQTIIHMVSQTEVTTIQSSTQDVFSWFNDNPVVRTIVTMFGSVADFLLVIVIIIILVKHKRVTKELKELLHMDSPDGDKPEGEKSEQ